MIGNVCLLIIICVFECAVYQFYKERKREYEENTPIQIVPAILVTKKIDKYLAQRSSRPIAWERRQLGLDKVSDILAEQDKLIYAARYYATFHTEQGETFKFRVNILEYEKLVEGKKGKLTYQGKNYIAFHTD